MKIAEKKLIVCDFSGIENRVLAWLSGQESLLKLMRLDLEAESLRRSGGEVAQYDRLKLQADLYCAMASSIYGRTITKQDKTERQVGKIAVLGLGYQMGPGSYQRTCEKFGVAMTAELAEKVVETYRKGNKMIPRLWYGLSDAAIAAVDEGGRHAYRGISFEVIGPWLYTRLPSGRRLAYRDPEVAIRDRGWGKLPALSYMGVDGYTQKWTRIDTYGGKLTENAVQAIARDLLVAAMFRCERAGYRTIFHVHDEIVAEVDEDFGSAHEMEDLMSIVPAWAKGCPVGAEGFESKRYRK